MLVLEVLCRDKKLCRRNFFFWSEEHNYCCVWPEIEKLKNIASWNLKIYNVKMAVYGTIEPNDQVNSEPLVQRSHTYLTCSNQIYCCTYLCILNKHANF